MMKFLTRLVTFSTVGAALGCATLSEPVMVCAIRPHMVIHDMENGVPVEYTGGLLCKKADGTRLNLPYNRAENFICRAPEDEMNLLNQCVGAE